MNFLDQIRPLVETRVKEAAKITSESILLKKIEDSPTPKNFIDLFQKATGVKIIAETKRQSPSQGAIALHLDPVQIAHAYHHAGAAAISVLTEPHFFNGKLQDLENIRVALPQAALLMKDFILHPYQLLQARLSGANAVLLIHAFLGPDQTAFLMRQATALGLTALIEVHNEDELISALELKAPLIGVNNRNLQTLQVDLKTSVRLSALFKNHPLIISESGIESIEDITHLTTCGYAGFLIGTALTRAGNPEQALLKLTQAKR